MSGRAVTRLAFTALAMVAVAAAVPTAQARDFFTSFFTTFQDNPALAPAEPPSAPLPFASEGDFYRRSPPEHARRHVAVSSGDSVSGGGQAYCVRSCDGRYFPITGSDKQSRAAACHSFCPASETRVVYGSNIDNAATDSGKPYSELPNAFRYRNELVAGCTCNGKDQIGLAPIRIAMVARNSRPTCRRAPALLYSCT